MKKTTFLVSLCMFAAFGGAAADGDSQWINYIDTNNTSGACPITAAYDANSVYWLTCAGTAGEDSGLDVMYNGDVLFQGSKTTSASANQNVCLVKMDKATGEKVWAVYSNSGETWTNQNGVVPTNDGGVIMVLRMRHSLGYESKPVNFVDAKGESHNVEWSCGDNRYNALVAVKLDKDGAIDWTRLYDVDHTFNGKHVAASVDLLSVVGDDDGNVLIAGRYVMPIHFPNADGSETVIKPDNMDRQSGDFTQQDNGDMFLVKLDPNGYFVDNFASKGVVMKGSIQKMILADNAIYTLGFMRGVAGEKCDFGGFTIEPLPDVFNIVVAKFNTDLDVQWVSVWNGERDATYNANVIQNVNICKAGGNIWVGGMGNGKFYDSATNVEVCSVNKQREGYLFKASAADGHLVNATASNKYNPYANKTALLGCFGAIQNPAGTGHVYTYGYCWSVNPAPFYVHAFDAETLAYNADCSFDLITGTTTTVYDLVYDPAEGVAYYVGRCKGTPAPKGHEAGQKAVNWKGFIGKALLPADMKASTNSIATVELTGGVDVIPGIGCVNVVNNGDDTMVNVYDITGRRAASVNVAADTETTVELRAGVYIVNGKKLLVR
ncbi:hypothetical protein [uncultured Muribaculum sp.]|nr:hypothetical protein [uncultured Muribaculum sp.]